MDILIGADPELFVRDTTTGKFVSAHGMIEGTKAAPLPVKGGAVQVDGMALEFNINPARTVDEFSSNISTVLGELRKMVPDKYEFVFTSVADFDPEYIKDQPEEARKLGCEPDFNAYTGEPNPAPDAAVNFRTASGHLHVGWTEDQDVKDPDHLEACTMLVQELDGYVGVVSVLIDPFSKRRELYGKAGAFRPKPYGVEYRTPSNVWLTEERYIRDFYDKTLRTTQMLLEGKKVKYRGVRTNIDNGNIDRLVYNINYGFPSSEAALYVDAIDNYYKFAPPVKPNSDAEDMRISAQQRLKSLKMPPVAKPAIPPRARGVRIGAVNVGMNAAPAVIPQGAIIRDALGNLAVWDQPRPAPQPAIFDDLPEAGF